MEDPTIIAGRFKERFLDRVAETKAAYAAPKNGRPVARLVPLDEPSAGQPTMRR